MKEEEKQPLGASLGLYFTSFQEVHEEAGGEERRFGGREGAETAKACRIRVREEGSRCTPAGEAEGTEGGLGAAEPGGSRGSLKPLFCEARSERSERKAEFKA